MTSPADSQYRDLESRVEVAEVVVMEDRARVIRRGRVALTAGLWRVRVAGVSPVASDRTLLTRVRSGPGALRVVESRVVREARVEEETSEEPDRDLAERLRDLRERLEHETRDESRAESLVASLDRAADLALEDLVDDVAWSRSDFDAWRTRLAEIDRRRAEAIEARNLARDRVHTTRNEIESLKRTTEPPRPGRRETIAWVECDLDAGSPGEHELEIEYSVPNACWRPYHVAELREARPSSWSVAFSTNGCVWQNTGEDWTDVSLVLSTERPALGAEPPRLETDEIRIRPKPEGVVVETRDQTVETAGLGRRQGRALAHVPGVDDGGEARTLRASHPATVRSDGRPVRVGLLSFESEAEASCICRPELAAAVILESVQTNGAEQPLLAGPVDLIRQNGLVGRTSIPFIAPNERFALGWGPESDLRVRREVEATEDERGALSSWITSHRRVELLFSNLGSRERAVRVTERVPVSEIEQVRIELDRKRTSPEAKPDADGMLSWDVALEPHGHRRIEIGYAVRKRKDVSGV